MSNEEQIRAIAEEVIDYINAEAQYELRAPFTSDRVAAIISKHLSASVPEQSPPCLKNSLGFSGNDSSGIKVCLLPEGHKGEHEYVEADDVEVRQSPRVCVKCGRVLKGIEANPCIECYTDDFELPAVPDVGVGDPDYKQLLQQANQDWAEDDSAIRELCRPHTDVDGDSYAVPSLIDIVRKTIEHVNAGVEGSSHSVCTFELKTGDRVYSPRTGTVCELLDDARVFIKETPDSADAGVEAMRGDRVEWLFRKKLGAAWSQKGREWIENYEMMVSGGGGIGRDTKSLYSSTAELIKEMVRAIETLALKPMTEEEAAKYFESLTPVSQKEK